MILAYILIIVICILLFFFLFRLYFKRDPKRIVPKGRVIVSPADGKIISVVDIDEKNEVQRKKGIGNVRTFCSEIGKKCCLISIFMNPLSVHINRVPLLGKVISIKHSKGTFLPAQNLKNGLVNEKTETLIRTSVGNIKVVQIAGIFVRRIENWLKKRQIVKTGQRLGMIHFGSQVWVIIPRIKSINVTIKEGDKVYAGKSIVARYWNV